MKKIFIIVLATLFVFCLLIVQQLQAQSPAKMSYQAVVRDASSALISEQTIGMQISILEGSADGTAVYIETQNPSTNANGLVSIAIGEGTVVSGSFLEILWPSGVFFIKTEIDIEGGTNYTISGTSQLMSVPYALHSDYADLATSALFADEAANVFSGDYNDLTNVPAGSDFDGDFSNLSNIPTGISDGDDDTQLTESEVDDYVANNGYLTAEVDGSTSNEIQDLDLTDHILTITNNSSATAIDLSVYEDAGSQLTEAEVDTYVANNGYLTSFTEVDGSTTNEIQDLQLSGDNLSITNNGSATTIDLSGYMDNTDTQLNETQVDAYVANNGYLTAEVDGDPTNEIELPSQTGQSGKILSTNGTSPEWITTSAGFDGAFSSLTGVPTGLSDGDDNTQLNESQVDAYVANNGYLTAEADGDPNNEIELPSQSGHSGKYLTTNGSAVSWEAPAAGGTTVTNISSNTTLSTGDQIVFINGAFTATFPASPTDGMKVVVCSTTSSAGINGNGKSLHLALTSLSSLTFSDGGTNMYVFYYSSTLGVWIGNL
ncbi:MAG: hypothetical protein ABJH98_14665 [Reichenbachiella sp.]|uniref:hypothetical protein n=1 Tax=Reichenbachiella sp. TaxID=2184521 RepID=UPI003296DC7A